MHNAAAQLPAATMAAVSSVVIFGDPGLFVVSFHPLTTLSPSSHHLPLPIPFPSKHTHPFPHPALKYHNLQLTPSQKDDGTPVSSISSSRVLVICHTGDDICAGGDLILLPHLTYFEDAGTAAAFVVVNM